MNYEPVIGLEIHVELKTKTKMFCGCRNDSEEKHPNLNVCPICLGQPGVLPSINLEAVKSVLRLGLALGAKIPSVSKFDRKSYFYPDLPKGYQISQYDEPLVLDGKLRGIRIRRIHLEEDTARLQHSPDMKESLVDFNRAGIPLMELVTEPDIKNGDEAVALAKELRLIFRYLGISSAEMEKGEMRVEANISLTKDRESWNKVEVKNLNSFRAVGEAINYEIKRQAEIISANGKIIQETRGWDAEKGRTLSQRSKEEAHDYRYLPEPDLPPLDLTRAGLLNLEELRLSIPELPEEKRQRFAREFGALDQKQIEILIEERRLAQIFEETISELIAEEGEETISKERKNELTKLVFNYLTSDIKGMLNEEGTAVENLKITPENLADLIFLVGKGEISSRIAKDLLKEMFRSGLDPRAIMAEKKISQVSDKEVVAEAVEAVLADNPRALSDYKKGRENALQFLIGQTMARLKGQGNPDVIAEILKEKLKRF